jgi:hypothetical protein
MRSRLRRRGRNPDKLSLGERLSYNREFQARCQAAAASEGLSVEQWMLKTADRAADINRPVTSYYGPGQIWEEAHS